jgi:hypothetical protein
VVLRGYTQEKDKKKLTTKDTRELGEVEAIAANEVELPTASKPPTSHRIIAVLCVLSVPLSHVIRIFRSNLNIATSKERSTIRNKTQFVALDSIDEACR